jgi:hypothetical protein
MGAAGLSKSYHAFCAIGYCFTAVWVNINQIGDEFMFAIHFQILLYGCAYFRVFWVAMERWYRNHFEMCILNRIEFFFFLGRVISVHIFG